MKRLIILPNSSFENINIVKKMLKTATNYSANDDYFIFDDFQDSLDALKNLSSEFLLDMIVSEKFNEFEMSIYNWLIDLFKKSNLRGFVAEKDILVKTLDKSEMTKNRVLKKYVNDFEIKEILKAFFECDLNTSKASSVLYLHRNTLINKIEKFYQETCYDPKKFKDAFVLYNLIK